MPSESAESQKVPFKAWVIAVLLRGVMRLLHFTYRLEFAEGEERLEELLRRDKPVILCAWHNRMFCMAGIVEDRLTRKGFKLTQMVSLSRDGNLGYLLGKWANLRIVRGSSNRGGSKALRGLFRELRKEGSSIVIMPDGSQGPVYRAKAGAVVLAQLSGAPLCLFSFRASRAWRVKSWDRLIVPKPFARIIVRIPEFIHVPRELNQEQLEAQRQRLEDALNALRESGDG